MKITDNYSAKLDLWAHETKVRRMPTIANIPHFGHKRFSSYEEMNAWKKELLIKIAEQGGAVWKK